MKYIILIITWVNRLLVGTMLFYYLSGLIGVEHSYYNGIGTQFFVGVFQVLSLIFLYNSSIGNFKNLLSIYLKFLVLFFVLAFPSVLLDDLLPNKYDLVQTIIVQFSFIVYPICLSFYYTYIIESLNQNKNSLK